MAALPSPIESETLSMPRNHCLWLHNDQSGSPASPQHAEPNPQKAVSSAQTNAMAVVSALQDQELMRQSEDFSLQGARFRKQAGKEKSRETKRANMALAAYTLRLGKFNCFNGTGLFGRDTRNSAIRGSKTLSTIGNASTLHGDLGGQGSLRTCCGSPKFKTAMRSVISRV
jgi:hypothetical protein